MDQRIRSDHPLRKIAQNIDFEFVYKCPGGKFLRRKSLHLQRHSMDYSAAKSDCAACALRPKCTENAAGRTIKRHLRQKDLDQMRAGSRSAWARRDQRIRQHLMERSFARSTRYGFDRARWRGLWRVQLQEYLVCALQNIQALIKYGRDPKRRAAMELWQVQTRWDQVLQGRSRTLFPQPHSLFGDPLKVATQLV